MTFSLVLFCLVVSSCFLFEMLLVVVLLGSFRIFLSPFSGVSDIELVPHYPTTALFPFIASAILLPTQLNEAYLFATLTKFADVFWFSLKLHYSFGSFFSKLRISSAARRAADSVRK